MLSSTFFAYIFPDIYLSNLDEFWEITIFDIRMQYKILKKNCNINLILSVL